MKWLKTNKQINKPSEPLEVYFAFAVTGASAWAGRKNCRDAEATETCKVDILRQKGLEQLAGVGQEGLESWKFASFVNSKQDWICVLEKLYCVEEGGRVRDWCQENQVSRLPAFGKWQEHVQDQGLTVGS